MVDEPNQGLRQFRGEMLVAMRFFTVLVVNTKVTRIDFRVTGFLFF